MGIGARSRSGMGSGARDDGGDGAVVRVGSGARPGARAGTDTPGPPTRVHGVILAATPGAGVAPRDD
ncbi:hypothetical protein VT50_0237870 [Streptomyces antioxidans]|uniref:Uncharacterized protein n=1 Tax=Streptomyces antioxidans TaxID=1507734 RepID=A0A1V4CML1_9ACTN|nr:hypothetical protein [Streptomyces antioxidans]OPF66177.1 hypothetical protein VT50_0237870 [Streptomyces antioxidans]